MRLLLLSVLFTCCLAGQSRAQQAPDVQWLTGIHALSPTAFDVAGQSMAVNKTGDLFLGFSFRDSVAIEGQVLKSGRNVFGVCIARYNTAGYLAWTQLFRGKSSYGIPTDIAADDTGNCYVACMFADTMWVDGNIYRPEPGTYYNTLLLKLSPTGSFVWIKQFSMAVKLAGLGAEGGPLIGGTLNDYYVFSPGDTTRPTIPGHADAFVARYAPDGALRSVKPTGGNSVGFSGLAINSTTGDLYMNGTYQPNYIKLGRNSTPMAITTASTCS